ncbi:nucleotidyl transferase AbiEii/AbiGii toxin family protein [Coleofasciculus sp. FACHB-SPT9]|uniref:nucleotidyl transferase AbiEii/AbiGii toxin family protein n=1 Tax=Cyanophyceae TaxID=3028117 RepID=UPI0016851B6F|nr:nucleotidyl transferase AbiEii/AbiGii toxin family protein [Coleofasciculus sp. FACHB-SPT9]MBD1888922.1 nucleotidyl transferase AbiEii/AbiGii toxin family protein [Coleofasciculus sp. FACHB-SPT9]
MLEPKDKKVLADIKAAVDSLELPMLIVGAGARLLIFDKQDKVQGRSTKDWDVAIPIASWSNFQTLSDRMTKGSSPRFSTTQLPHKFIHIGTKTEVDIVPFGGIGEPDQQIEWADGNQMNVMGLEEALIHASVETIDDLEFQVVNTPAFLVLKLFAWGDRQERTKKDLQDIDFILVHYSDDDRVFDELAEELAEGQIEYLDAAIYLLGRDIRKIFRDETVVQLNALLERLVHKSDDDAPDSNEWRLKVLKRGINS